MPGGRINANGLDQFMRRPVDELVELEHVAPPASLPVVQLRRVAQLLGLAPGVVGESLEDSEVTTLVTNAERMYEHASTLESRMLNNPQLWGVNVFDSVEERLARLADVRRVVDDVRHRNSTGKMRNVKFGDDTLTAANSGARELKHGVDVLKAVERIEPVIGYLQEAGRIHGDADPLHADAEALRQRVVKLLIAETIDMSAAQQIASAADTLRSRYAAEATHAHPATVTAVGRRVLVPVPFNPDGAWGAKREHRVHGTINGMGVRAVIEPLGDGFGIHLGPAWRRDCGIEPGDTVEVLLAPEGPQRTDLAPDVAAAPEAEPEAGAFFDSLAQFYRRLPALDRRHQAPTGGEGGAHQRDGHAAEGR